MLTQLADVKLLNLPGMLDAMLDEYRFEHPHQRHCIPRGRWLPFVSHVGDELFALLLEI
ncbi:hypothetical protein U8C40_04185 [Sinorhizobium medicae]|nr:hypothetical protein U8C40_04185 [Sinorhizobium medicae]